MLHDTILFHPALISVDRPLIGAELSSSIYHESVFLKISFSKNQWDDNYIFPPFHYYSNSGYVYKGPTCKFGWNGGKNIL